MTLRELIERVKEIDELSPQMLDKEVVIKDTKAGVYLKANNIYPISGENKNYFTTFGEQLDIIILNNYHNGDPKDIDNPSLEFINYIAID